MTNKELQLAIDSLLAHLRSESSYTTLATKQLEALFAEQLKRSEKTDAITAFEKFDKGGE